MPKLDPRDRIEKWWDDVGNTPGNPKVGGSNFDQVEKLYKLFDGKEDGLDEIDAAADALKFRFNYQMFQGVQAQVEGQDIEEHWQTTRRNQLAESLVHLLAERRIGQWLNKHPVKPGPKSKKLSASRTNAKLPSGIDHRRAPEYRRLADIPETQWWKWLADQLELATTDKKVELSRTAALEFASELVDAKVDAKRQSEHEAEVDRFNRNLAKARKAAKRTDKTKPEESAPAEATIRAVNEAELFRFDCGDFQKLNLTALPARPSEKPRFIISDPPYLKHFLFRDKKRMDVPCLIEDFASWSFKVLAPRGIVAAMFGNLWQYEALKIFEKAGFDWKWTMIATFEGGNWARIKHKGVLSCHKSIMLFQRKGERLGKTIEGDVIQCGMRDKDFHIWQQDVETFEQVVAKLTDPGDLVVDPFGGTGTTGVACLNLKRRFIGSELNPKTHKTGLWRLQKCVYEGETWRKGSQLQRLSPTYDDMGNIVYGAKIQVGVEVDESGDQREVKE